MTLSGWFREYVYIPLGGNRKGKARTYVNLLIVWCLTGFWHGANWNFVLWGLYFFLILALEKSVLGAFLQKHKVFGHIYAKLLIAFSWMIFAITDLKSVAVYFAGLFSFRADPSIVFYLRNYGIVLIVGCILSTPILCKLYNQYKNKWQGILAACLILVLSVASLADAGYNPFLYFRF